MKVIYSVAFGVGAFFALNCGSGEDHGGYSSSSSGSFISSGTTFEHTFE